jgi:hypothetical protein
MGSFIEAITSCGVTGLTAWSGLCFPLSRDVRAQEAG